MSFCPKRCFDFDFVVGTKKQRTCSFDSTCSTIIGEDESWLSENRENFIETVKEEIEKNETINELMEDYSTIFTDDLEEGIEEIIQNTSTKIKRFQCYDSDLLSELNTVVYNSFWMNGDDGNIFLSDEDIKCLSADVFKLVKSKMTEFLESKENFF